MGISRQPVRDAFWRLSKLGLVLVRPQRATVVTQISTTAVMQARFVRTAIEVETLRLAAGRFGAAEFAALDAILAEQAEAVRADARERFHVARRRIPPPDRRARRGRLRLGPGAREQGPYRPGAAPEPDLGGGACARRPPRHSRRAPRRRRRGGGGGDAAPPRADLGDSRAHPRASMPTTSPTRARTAARRARTRRSARGVVNSVRVCYIDGQQEIGRSLGATAAQIGLAPIACLRIVSRVSSPDSVLWTRTGKANTSSSCG